jgi:hypothetical protein
MLKMRLCGDWKSHCHCELVIRVILWTEGGMVRTFRCGAIIKLFANSAPELLRLLVFVPCANI